MQGEIYFIEQYKSYDGDIRLDGPFLIKYLYPTLDITKLCGLTTIAIFKIKLK